MNNSLFVVFFVCDYQEYNHIIVVFGDSGFASGTAVY